ncbi:MAG TPA: hypothetical protein VFP72_01335 [Kineosporiaceae bacterium]|nr:hypothetical protein [Kineosporiaceae bacterium]
MRRATSVVGWLVVVLVGVGILGLVYGFSLYPRLHAGQRVVDNLTPAFTPEAAAGDRAGINFLSDAVNTLDPIVTPKGGAASEVPKLVSFVSKRTGLTQTQVLTTLQQKFPHTTALLQTLPLSSVNEEVPGLVQFLATTLKTSPDNVLATLKQNFPAIHQAVTALPTVTQGWNAVPGTEKLTRFSTEQPVRSAPEIRSYYSSDVVPVVERNTTNMAQLHDWWPKVDSFPLILTVVGALAAGLGVVMLVFSLMVKRGRGVKMTAWAAVFVVGAAVFGLVFGAGLFARLGGAGHLVDDAAPVFTDARIAGDKASIGFVSSVVDLADPIVLTEGGAAAEVPKLVAFVSRQTGLSQAAVLSTLQQKFPHTTALLQAIPLSEVTAELPRLVAFLSTALKATPEQVNAALGQNFPHLAQAITYLPKVTEGWKNVPGTTAGSPMHTAVGVRDYFGKAVVPALAANQADFNELNGHWPPLILVTPLLGAISVVVMLWAGIFFCACWGVGRWRYGPGLYEVPGEAERVPAHLG